MKTPRFVIGEEEGSMQLASELVDLGLTWEEAQRELKHMKGSENLEEVASRVISKRGSKTPPGGPNAGQQKSNN